MVTEVTIAIYMLFQLAYLHLTLAHSKGNGKGKGKGKHILTANIS